MAMVEDRTPAELGARIRAELEGRRVTLDSALSNKGMRIDAPSGCPEELAARIAAHNDSVAAWQGRAKALDDDAVKLPMAMTNLDGSGMLTGAEVEGKSAEFRQRRYDLLQERISLLVAMAPILRVAAEYVDTQRVEAEAAVERARAKAEKGLAAVGGTAEGRRAVGEKERERILRIQGGLTPIVLDAKKAVKELADEAADLRRRAHKTNDDVALVGKELIRLFKVLTGPV